MRSVLKAALTGYNPEIDTDPNHFSLYVDQLVDYVLIKEKTRGTQSVNGTSNIVHGLGYVPLCFVFVEISSGVWKKLFSTPIDGTGYSFEVNSTNLVLINSTGSAKNFSYYIFYDNVDGTSNNTIVESNAVIKVSKIGEDANSKDPNDFIFHSDLNTFKIIVEGTKQITALALTSDQSFTQAHGLSFTPLVDAFARETSGPTTTQVFKPNGDNIRFWNSVSGWTSTDVRFNYVKVDATNITFNFDNASSDNRTLNIRYFCLEGI